MVPRTSFATELPAAFVGRLDDLLRAATVDERARGAHLHRASRLIAELVDADHVALVVPSGSTALRVIAGSDAETVGDVVTALGRYPELGRVLETGLPVLVADAATSDLTAASRPAGRTSEAVSLIAAPVRLPDVAAVLRARSGSRAFGRADLRTLVAVAEHLERALADVSAVESRPGAWSALATTLADTVLEVTVDGRIVAAHPSPSSRLEWPDDLVGSPVGRVLVHADHGSRPVAPTDLTVSATPTVLALAARVPGGAPVPVRATVTRTSALPPRSLVALTVLPPEAPAGARVGPRDREAALRARIEETVAELERLELRLAQAETSRHRFVSASAHELKTPITVVQSYLEIVLNDFDDDLGEEPRSFLRIAYENVLRLRRLVTDLVDLAALDAGRIQLDIGRVELAPLLEAVHRELAPISRRAGIALRLEIGDPPPVVRGAAQRVEQIVRNLLENALKFTPSGGVVTLGSAVRDDTVMVQVVDSGVGIPADRLDTVFEEFVQATPAIDHRRRGAGLGLSIARRVALALGGRITVDSVEGEGSTFTVWLPRWPEEP